MRDTLKSWLFFTALTLFLLTAALTVPELGQRFFGSTGRQITAAADELGQQAQEVWAGLRP